MTPDTDRLRELRCEAEALAAAPYVQMMPVNPRAIVSLLDEVDRLRDRAAAAEADAMSARKRVREMLASEA